MFDKAKREFVDEVKKELAEDKVRNESFHPDNALNLIEHRELEAMLKRSLGARHVLICAELLDGTQLTYIPEEIGDKDLVYLIQTLRDLRVERLTSDETYGELDE